MDLTKTKHRYRILPRYAVCLLLTVLLTAALTSCVDDTFDGGGKRERVMLRLKVDLPSMNVMTRSDISEGLDQRVESLWIGVYKAGDNGARTGMTEVPDPQSLQHNNNQAEVSLNAMTGDSYIVAVANYTDRHAIDANGNEVSLTDALAGADTWQKFQNLSVMLNTDGSVSTDVPVNPLLMSGHYMSKTHPDGAYTEIEPVTIPHTGTLSGSVHLRRLISQVRFNVTYNTDNISDFEIIGWRVCNLPNSSWIAERATGTLNAGDVRQASSGAESFQNSQETSLTVRDGTKWSFDWWQLENKRTGLTPPSSLADPYQYREEEYKDASGANTGIYKSLVQSAGSDDPNNNATFVEFKVRMTLKVDEDGKPIAGSQVRVCDGVYTVHLGYLEGSGVDKARDFNVRRNTRYTYNVTVNNVNSIMVEADSDLEKIPGAEGIISDVTEQFVQLDAHYGVFNIYLSETDLEVFDYLIRCYDENGSQIVIDSKVPASVPSASSALRKYLNWVEIRSTTSAGVLSEYKPHPGTNKEGYTYYLDEFKSGIADGSIKAGHFTVFFNEYAYETSTTGDESSGLAWHGYVNKPDRQVWIRVREHKSSDGESSYFQSKYAFSQKSIQTYYDSDSPTALGVEHINESYGLNLRATSHGSDADNGRYNTARFIRDGYWYNNLYKWSSYITPTEAQSVNAINNIQGVTRAAVTHPLPALTAFSGTVSASSYDPDQNSSRKYIDARNACTNRNRDLDGDGKIDAHELRWYVPTSNQIIRIILGRRSLVSPIMDYQTNSSLASSSTSQLPSLIIYGSNGSVVWAMEGMSTSDWGKYYQGTPWNVRCVRNLGTDMSARTFDATVSPAYRKRDGETDIIEMEYYEGKSVRSEKMNRIIPHTVADQDYNRVYKAFQYSDAITLGDLNGYNNYGSDWATWLRTTNPCSGVSALSGTGWRIPNQKEITIMMTQGIAPTSLYMPSATFSFYNNAGTGVWNNSLLDIDNFKIMCITTWKTSTQQSYSSFSGSGTTVRCVRDVD